MYLGSISIIPRPRHTRTGTGTGTDAGGEGEKVAVEYEGPPAAQASLCNLPFGSTNKLRKFDKFRTTEKPS